MNTVLVNMTEIIAYPKAAVRNLTGLKRGPKRPQMAKIMMATLSGYLVEYTPLCLHTKSHCNLRFLLCPASGAFTGTI